MSAPMLAIGLLAASAAGGDEMRVFVTPAATGLQMVRASLPMPRGFLSEGQRLVVTHRTGRHTAQVRILTKHPGSEFARRALVTVPLEFTTTDPVELSLAPAPRASGAWARPPAEIGIQGDELHITLRDGTQITAQMQAPPVPADVPVAKETIEASRQFLWERYCLDDPTWPRILEVRVDRLGTVALIGHLQRPEEGFGYAPSMGWSVDLRWNPQGRTRALKAYHPTDRFRPGKKGPTRLAGGAFMYAYGQWFEHWKIPMQQASWRRTEIVVAPEDQAELTAAMQYPHAVRVDSSLYDELYGTGLPPDLGAQPRLVELIDYHHQAIVRSMAHGKDWGNVTGYADSNETGHTLGMNRLNHCPPIFDQAWRTGDRRLVEVGLLWCDNMYDQSLWWGPAATGGTRYNNLNAMGQPWPFGDDSYMWRSNSAVNFCTKGYDSFLLAYEETGDPRMLRALNAQVDYAAEHVHANQGEARNVGDVRDFVRLYEYTGEQRYLDEALRLFRELREVLSKGDLFSQSGRPIEKDGPFIDDDQFGYEHPFAKPYIIGYALAGLPELARHVPDEPKLKDVIQAVADFLAGSMDPLGAWRYPHPRSSSMIVSQAMEHAWQLVQADRVLGPQEHHLDAIEAVLRQRIHGWLKTGKCLNGLGGWEVATGAAKDRQDLRDLYQRPEDRGSSRDYAEGQISNGGSAPEGLVYFPEVLAYYLEHRPVERLMREPAPDEPLGIVLGRLG